MKNSDLSSIECLILTTEEAITYFNSKLSEYNSLSKLNLEETDDKNIFDFNLVSSEIEEFISRKIDSLKKIKNILVQKY